MAKKNTGKKVAKKPIVKKVEEEVKVEELEQAVDETVQAEPEDNATEEVEVMNGDPAVVIPAEEVETFEDEPAETFEDEPADEEPMVDDGPFMEDPTTGDLVPAEPLREKQEEEAPAPQEKITPKKNVIKRMFGYIWNGQEMDY